MPAPAAEMTIPVNVAATAFREAMQLTFDVVVSSGGEVRLRLWGRASNTHSVNLLAELDAYEVERFAKAFGECRELVAAIQERGATFKIG